MDIALTSDPELNALSTEIGWNLASPLDIGTFWRTSPFIHDGHAFNGPLSYVIYTLAKTHHTKLAHKLISCPWNTLKMIKMLPKLSDKMIIKACKLATDKNAELTEILLLSNKRSMICCENMLGIDADVISCAFTDIRDHLLQIT